jgi:chemotaxis protein MotA
MQAGIIVGLLVAFGAICTGNLLEGGDLGSFLQPTAAYIVLGGTLGAVLVQFSIKALHQTLQHLSLMFFTVETYDLSKVRSQLLALSAKSRREGLVSIEQEVSQLKEPFIKRSLELVIDGFQAKTLRSVLMQEIAQKEEEQESSAAVLDSAGGYAPTIGILGAVLGLIHVMENLSDPSKIGPGIAVAFVSTLYGVSLSNLFFLPLAGRLRNQARQQQLYLELIMEIACSLADGEGPRLLEQRISAYIKEESKKR